MTPTLASDGFTMVSKVLSEAEIRNLLAVLGPVSGAGNRGLFSIHAIAELANSRKVTDLVRLHLPVETHPVRAIHFDKSPQSNWLVPWHQDLTIALRRRRDVPGFGPWSMKAGIPHVQPPVECLQQMLTVRIHLDATGAVNGALRVLPGTHLLGRLAPEGIQALRAERSEVLCAAAAGDALLLRPLLLHASSRSSSPAHRRILHLEYAGFTLPSGLDWQEWA
jgi:hypothetical protein